MDSYQVLETPALGLKWSRTAGRAYFVSAPVSFQPARTSSSIVPTTPCKGHFITSFGLGFSSAPTSLVPHWGHTKILVLMSFTQFVHPEGAWSLSATSGLMERRDASTRFRSAGARLSMTPRMPKMSFSTARTICLSSIMQVYNRAPTPYITTHLPQGSEQIWQVAQSKIDGISTRSKRSRRLAIALGDAGL